MTQNKLLKQIGFYALVVVIVVFSVFPVSTVESLSLS